MNDYCSRRSSYYSFMAPPNPMGDKNEKTERTPLNPTTPPPPYDAYEKQQAYYTPEK